MQPPIVITTTTTEHTHTNGVIKIDSVTEQVNGIVSPEPVAPPPEKLYHMDLEKMNMDL